MLLLAPILLGLGDATHSEILGKKRVKRWMTTAAKDGKNRVDLLFRERKCFEVGSEGVQTGFVSEWRGRVIPCCGPKTEKAREPVESLVPDI